MARRSVTTTEERRDDTVAPAAADDRDRRVLKATDVVWFLTSIVAAIILVRFVLLLLGAQTTAPFVEFWYNISAPLIAPFAGMFGNIDTYNVYTGSRLELESLVALLVYALIGYLLAMGIRLLTREPNERQV